MLLYTITKIGNTIQASVFLNVKNTLRIYCIMLFSRTVLNNSKLYKFRRSDVANLPRLDHLRHLIFSPSNTYGICWAESWVNYLLPMILQRLRNKNQFAWYRKDECINLWRAAAFIIEFLRGIDFSSHEIWIIQCPTCYQFITEKLFKYIYVYLVLPYQSHRLHIQ